MSDTTGKKEESASVSQDQVNRLLRDVSQEEVAPGVEESGTDNISQGDIARLLDVALGEISPDDLEADLMRDLKGEETPPHEPPDKIDQNQEDNLSDGGTEGSAETEDSGADAVFEDDINSVLNGNAEEDGAPDPGDTEDPGIGAVSQDDINGLLKDKAEEADTLQGETDELESELLSQAELDHLLEDGSEAGPLEKTEVAVNAQDGADSQDNMDGAEDQQDNLDSEPVNDPEEEEERSKLISQEELDRLLVEDGETLSPPADDPAGKMAQNEMEELSAEAEGSETHASEADDDSSLISQEDLDQLIGGAEEGNISTAEEDRVDDDGLVSQEDIDRLLMGDEDDDEKQDIESDDDSGLVGQEDIDQLLKGDDKNGTGGETNPDDEKALIAQDDIDQLLKDVDQEDDLLEQQNEKEEQQPDQVILKEADDIVTSSNIKGGKKKSRKWYKSNVFMICAALTLLLLILSFGGFMYFQSSSNEVTESEVNIGEIEQQVSAIPMPSPVQGATSLVMEGFIVLAPVDKKDMVFLKADVSIEFQDLASAAEIKKHEAYFRYIIYNELKAALISQEASNISEPLLIKRITQTLKKAMPGEIIKDVAFSKFDIISTEEGLNKEQAPAQKGESEQTS